MLRNIFGGSSLSARGNEFVGQNVDLGQQRLHVTKVLGEGGYGFVFAAYDISTKKQYALKRLMASDQTAKNTIMQEINFLKKLKGHPNIIKFIAAASTGNEKTSHGMTEFLILTELCSGGKLIDLLMDNTAPLELSNIMTISVQTCRAISHMHNQSPPIIHRDIKIENLLLNEQGVIQLCDFGSATTKALFPDETWTALQRGLAELEIQNNTTPMYRAPEMIDLYSNNPITTKADVWALGCVLYFLSYTKHPFEDSSKLKILNANYYVPDSESNISQLQPLIDTMLQVNPQDRSTVGDVLYQLEAICEAKGLDTMMNLSLARHDEQGNSVSGTGSSSSANVFGSNAIFGNVVKGAGLLFNNIKDVSSKVVQSVAGYVRNDLDISFITSRIIVMSFPADGIESAYRNSIDDVRIYLDANFPDHYVVINVSQRLYKVSKLNDRVFENGWNPKQSPRLNQLISLCRKINNFLRQDKKNVVVIHCLDGRVSSAVLVCAFLLFCKLFNTPTMALDMFCLRRLSPGQSCEMNASQRRYLNYVSQLVWEPRILPHKHSVFLKRVVVRPLPLFNKARNGCRPFVEIYENEVLVLSTAQDIDQMREFSLPCNKIEMEINMTLQGDISIALNHGRSTLGAKVQGKITTINIFMLQFHSGFLSTDAKTACFSRNELDTPEVDEQKLPLDLKVDLDIEAKFCPPSGECLATEPWDKMNLDKVTPTVCFTSKEELLNCRKEFGLNDIKVEELNSRASYTDSENEKKVGRSTFFDSDQPSKVSMNNAEFRTLQQDNEIMRTNMQDPDELFNSMKDIDEAREMSSARNEMSTLDKEIVTTPQLIDISTDSELEKTLHNLPNVHLDKKASTENQQHRGAMKDLKIDNGFTETTTESSSQSNEVIFCNNDLFPTQLKSNIGAVNHFEATDPFNTCDDILKSPNNNVFSTDKASDGEILDHVGYGKDLTRKLNTSLKKNRSTNDLFEEKTDDDFFKELSERHIPGERKNSKTTADNFSISSENVVDPFALTTDHSRSSGNWQTAIEPSVTMKHSSSDGDLLGDWTQTDLFAQPAKASSSRGAAYFHSASSSDLSDERRHVDPFVDLASFANIHTGSHAFQKGQSAANNSTISKSAAGVKKSQISNRSTTQMMAPNYRVNVAMSNDSVFGGKRSANGGLGGRWGQKPASKDEFSDILGAQGFKPSSEQQKETLKQLKKIGAKGDSDPIRERIREWADGKERNIRALLCSLHTVLWDGEDRWETCGMHQLLHPNEVKKFYRKACLVVHPDKLTGTPHEHLARAIFVELNEAWTLFDTNESK